MTVQLVTPKWLDRRMGVHVLASFRKGLQKLGVPHVVVDEHQARPSEDPMVCWGVEKKRFRDRAVYGRLQQAQREGPGKLVILERGFVRRDVYYSVGFDWIAGRGTYPAPRPCPPDRWEALGVQLQPWRAGHEIYVIGQVPWDTSCQHVNFQHWVMCTVAELREEFPDTPVIFRPHPLRPAAINTAHMGVPVDMGPLSRALENAALVVTFSSTVGVDATIAGRRVRAADPTSMVHGLWQGWTGWRRPRREQWAHRLAYSQWTREEMEAGIVWQNMWSE